MRVGILSGCLILVLLSGCLNGGTETQDPSGTIVESPTPTIEPENSTFTFYLLFPDECPEELIGTTTFNSNTVFWDEHEKFCGYETTEIPGNTHCGTFKVHDELFQVWKNDTLYADVAVSASPGRHEEKVMPWAYVRFTWRDDEGVFAVAQSQVNPLDYYLVDDHPASTGEGTTADRDSQGTIWLDITLDAGHCAGVDTGRGSSSGFYVLRAAACAMDDFDHASVCRSPAE